MAENSKTLVTPAVIASTASLVIDADGVRPKPIPIANDPVSYTHLTLLTNRQV